MGQNLSWDPAFSCALNFQPSSFWLNRFLLLLVAFPGAIAPPLCSCCLKQNQWIKHYEKNALHFDDPSVSKREIFREIVPHFRKYLESGGLMLLQYMLVE